MTLLSNNALKKVLCTIALVMVIGLIGACKKEAGADDALRESFHTGTFRYKMTVTIETPEGIKTGSSVREVLVKQNPKLTPETIPHVSVKGEAVVVDLGNRGKIFAILRNSTGPDYAHMVVFKAIGGNLSPDGVEYLQKATGQKAVLLSEDYPMLVMFKDLQDPKTIVPVLDFTNEEKAPFTQFIKADHFEELFGKGVKLKEITIEMTDEPVTWGIKDILPSFGNIPRPIGLGEFVRGSRNE